MLGCVCAGPKHSKLVSQPGQLVGWLISHGLQPFVCETVQVIYICRERYIYIFIQKEKPSASTVVVGNMFCRCNRFFLDGQQHQQQQLLLGTRCLEFGVLMCLNKMDICCYCYYYNVAPVHSLLCCSQLFRIKKTIYLSNSQKSAKYTSHLENQL